VEPKELKAHIIFRQNAEWNDPESFSCVIGVTLREQLAGKGTMNQAPNQRNIGSNHNSSGSSFFA
jgi:hypothetical protein